MAKQQIEKRDYYQYTLKCECCETETSFCGLSHEEHTWQDFYGVMQQRRVWNVDFEYCDECKKWTRTILISFDPDKT